MKTYIQKGNASLLIINHKTSKKVPIKNVVLLEGNVNYTTLYLESGRKEILSHTLKFYEDFLKTHGFLRVHRGYLINPDYVKEYCCDSYVVTMTNGQQASISRRKVHRLKQM
jgi:DNA-binding LytR/AlgR family response regulator